MPGWGRWLAALTALLWLALPLDARAQSRTVDRAVFRIDGQAPQSVALPHTWAQQDIDDLRAPAHYELAFELDAVPDESLALVFTRLSTLHAVRVNGELVSDQNAAGSNPGLPHPALLGVPPALLRPGHNTVGVEVQHAGSRAGLSSVTFGPMSAMREQYQRHQLLYVTVPQALNMASGGLALLLILIWWRRRSEVALGSFGVLALFGSVRNAGYYAPWAIASAVHLDWLFYAAQAWTLVLFAVFCQAFAGVRWPRYTRALLALAALATVTGLAAAPAHRLPELRTWTYPVMLLATLPALWLCLRHALARPAGAVIAQAVGAVALIGAVAHDYAFQTLGLLPVTETFWLPYVMPLVLIAVTLVLMRRMIAAMGEVEALNAELEARVALRTRELTLANEATTRFVATASHDLRQPLVTVGLLVGMARDASVSSATRDMLDRADQAVGAMEHLLSGLLDLSRLESGVVQPRFGPVRVADLFASIAAHEQSTATLKGLRLRLRPTTAVVRSDALMLERILRNLVSNALHYTARGGVLVAARRRAGVLRLEVHDTGVGIAADDQDAIYREFVRLDTPLHEGSRGMGLGLSIARRSARLLGHRLGLRSQPGRGSCFWIEIDPSAQPLPDEGPALAAPLAPPQSRWLQGRHLIVVDDDAGVRHALGERLKAWGARVHGCGSIAALRRHIGTADAPPPDLLISDHHLPDGDGFDALGTVRAAYGPVPAVLVTADSSARTLATLQASGLPVLHKPFRTEALMDAIVRGLGVTA